MSSSDKRADSGLRDVSGQNELRVQVAELHGWKGPDHPEVIAWCDDAMNRAHCWWQGPDGKYSAPLDGSKIPSRMPDYPNDLNACAEFEKVVRETYIKSETYLIRLRQLCVEDNGDAKDTAAAYATAEQRCRAFVATMQGRSL